METPLPNWLLPSPKLLPEPGQRPTLQESLRSPTGIYPPIGPMLKGAQDFMQALSSSTDGGGISPQTSTQDLKDALHMIYQHLNEKHHLDRVVHALYLHPDGRISLTKKEPILPSDVSSIAFAHRVHAVFPRPAELPTAIKKTRESSHDMPLLYLLLIDPPLRYRLCMIAHLFEAALAITNGYATYGEHPRQLSIQEMSYVLQKLHDLFIELFQWPVAQASFRRLLSHVYEWTVAQTTMGATKDDNEEEPEFPDIVKEIFPSYDLIFQEYRNIMETGRHDQAFQAECHMLFKFVMLSLKQPKFTSAPDWTTEGRTVMENLRKALGTGRYRGPAQRLIRIIVSATDQLWEGGSLTDTSLAIEKCLHTVILKSLRGSDPVSDLGAGVGMAGAWDVMDDFERLIHTASSNMAPLPLPSIVWSRNNSEFCLDGVVVQFPHLLPNHVQLNSNMEFDKQKNKHYRQWHLKIKGLEIESKNVPYCYVSESRTRRRLVDVGELSLLIPPNSLDIDVKFMLNPPEIRRGATTALRRAQGRPGKSNPIASAAHAVLSSATSIMERSRRQDTADAHHIRITTTSRQAPASTRSDRRRTEPVRATDMGGTVVNAGARDTRTAARIISRVLYPNPQPNRGSRDPYRQEVHRVEPSTGRITWGRPQRQLPHGNGSGPLRDYYRNLLERARDEVEHGQEHRSTPPLHPELIPTPSPYSDYFGAQPQNLRRGFVDMVECKIHLRKLDVQVHETKRPLLHTFAHIILVRKFRKAMEQTLQQAVFEIVNAINRGVDEVMEFSHEELQMRHTGGGGARSQAVGSQQQQQRYLSPQQFGTSRQDTGIFAALPIFSSMT